MVDDVSRVGASQSQQANQTAKPRQGSNPSSSVVDSGESNTTAPRAVEVELSKEIQRSEERAEFDAVRVRELKDQIERGSYPIDTEKLAEKFADLEQLL
ncbi:MAG: flagellar biosynthesis anti-sigma factor FlgM [Gammaproteobacteria bacterium]|uniref:Negative regulator of flagellin synthesis n=1 Tax=OM182 bacterium TaxID=2510334 RepID=A0A520S107_9GAMM|nr:flagellar biosynthesis anti-sigma factor FlgM [Gammaproteobacteria bacterium]OUV67432.1 MAG: flagellar biosynthesis anti-sigma factor FlgM [Gammaproteobacteria bacterium TMED133]RZO76146.1 MAG: flagellar biosynthesis anti-sigma factor FlgM [OM182 bacterium]